MKSGNALQSIIGIKSIRTGVRAVLAAGIAALTLMTAHTATAQTNLVTNGSFAITGGPQSFQFGSYNGYTPSGESLPGWASTSYAFVFTPTSTVAVSTYGPLSLYSTTTTPSTSFNNASPTGGNFIAEDSSYGTSPITQTVTGLVAGQSYKLGFDWAGAQQTGFSGATTDKWQVSLGGSTQSTGIVNDVSNGFTGWMHQTMSFVATSTSEQLSFLAFGTPSGSQPPFALLANVSLVSAPEPAGVAIMVVGIAGMVGLSWRRRNGARGRQVAV